MNQTKHEHIHFIGIGGSSMSGLAELAAKQGYLVSGSDRTDSDKLKYLRTKGIRIYSSQIPENITDDISLVVYTLAVPDSNPELAEARRRKIPVVERGVYLGKIAAHYKYSVAVAGTHGKTSTTSMLSSIVLSAGKEPSIHIGGVFPRIGSNVLASHSDYFITEACEYHENFLNIHPYGGIILNVEAEHLDYYKDLGHIKTAFSKFASSCAPQGFLVVCADNDLAREIAAAANCPVYFYSINDPSASYYAGNIQYSEEGTSYTLFESGQPLHDIFLHVPGLHNVSNSLAAAAAAIRLGCSAESIAAGLDAFHGTGRRFEKKGTYHGAAIVDDYAHHPTEIAATLAAARSTIRPGNKLYAIFQPHTYSRARIFLSEFTKVLKEADQVIVTDIYSAREKDPGTISGLSMAEYFTKNGVNAKYISDFDEIADYVKACAADGDIAITLGAGDVNKVIKKILETCD
ncbi:MAG: UDP-N-acetylmuramate--L-alanine ligase [Clostridia bacterium]